jgi:sensor histidine kinase YesM
MWTVFFFLTVSAPFIGVLSKITPDLQYHRGPMYPLVLLPLIGILLLNLLGTIQRRKQFSQKTFRSFIIAMLPMTVTLCIQLFIDVFPILDLSFVLSALTMYSYILTDQIEQDRRRQQEMIRQQQEIANQRASIMVLQMRPHFIYNTMTSIYCLCDQDPKLARRVVMDFTTYLRKNFTAVASSEPIPFTSELEHVRAYLAVEQTLYEDSLFVEYDTPHTWFRVPPLTLQPIVENAVKHGRDPYAGPFHISIRTRKTDNGSEIVVADDGRGFDQTDDSEPHIALKNIRQRLEIMCSGSLTIVPNEGRGTVVTVTIPDSTGSGKG